MYKNFQGFIYFIWWYIFVSFFIFFPENYVYFCAHIEMLDCFELLPSQ
jgi:hypothetical protein